jgi:hypothetical protein
LVLTSRDPGPAGSRGSPAGGIGAGDVSAIRAVASPHASAARNDEESLLRSADESLLRSAVGSPRGDWSLRAVPTSPHVRTAGPSRLQSTSRPESTPREVNRTADHATSASFADDDAGADNQAGAAAAHATLHSGAHTPRHQSFTGATRVAMPGADGGGGGDINDNDVDEDDAVLTSLETSGYLASTRASLRAKREYEVSLCSMDGGIAPFRYVQGGLGRS